MFRYMGLGDRYTAARIVSKNVRKAISRSGIPYTPRHFSQLGFSEVNTLAELMDQSDPPQKSRARLPRDKIRRLLQGNVETTSDEGATAVAPSSEVVSTLPCSSLLILSLGRRARLFCGGSL